MTTTEKGFRIGDEVIVTPARTSRPAFIGTMGTITKVENDDPRVVDRKYTVKVYGEEREMSGLRDENLDHWKIMKNYSLEYNRGVYFQAMYSRQESKIQHALRVLGDLKRALRPDWGEQTTDEVKFRTPLHQLIIDLMGKLEK